MMCINFRPSVRVCLWYLTLITQPMNNLMKFWGGRSSLGVPDPHRVSGDVSVLFSRPNGLTSWSRSGWPVGVFISTVTDCCGSGKLPTAELNLWSHPEASKANNQEMAACFCSPWKKHSAPVAVVGNSSICMNVFMTLWNYWAGCFHSLKSDFMRVDCVFLLQCIFLGYQIWAGWCVHRH